MSWFLFVLSFFQCVSPFLKVKMNDQKKTSKFRETSSINKNTSANSGPQRLVEDSRVLQLQREAIHDPWSPSRVGRLVRKWGKYYNQLQTTHCCWWLLLHLKDADLWHPCPKNCTCLLFSSVLFMFFTSKHYGVRLGSWATVYYLYENVHGICMHMYRPQGRNLCAITSNLVPLRNMHITNLRTSQRPFPSLEVDDPSDK